MEPYLDVYVDVSHSFVIQNIKGLLCHMIDVQHISMLHVTLSGHIFILPLHVE